METHAHPIKQWFRGKTGNLITRVAALTAKLDHGDGETQTQL